MVQKRSFEQQKNDDTSLFLQDEAAFRQWLIEGQEEDLEGAPPYLERGLWAVNHIFLHAPRGMPEAGFTARWQARLVDENQKERHRQALKMLVLCANITLVIFAIFSAQFLHELRWLPMMILDELSQLAGLFIALGQLRDGLFGIVGSWIGLSMLPLWLLAWGAVWGYGGYWLFTRRYRLLKRLVW